MRYGAEEVFKPLRTVILAKPDYFTVTTAVLEQQKPWVKNIDQEKAQVQHHALAEQLRRCGVSVYYVNLQDVNSQPALVDQVFIRDVGVIGSQGAILSSLSAAWRKREEEALITFCKQYQIPLTNEKELFQFEGGDFFFMDKQHFLLGKGSRTTIEASDLEKRLGTQRNYTIDHASPHHLDAVFNVVRNDLVVVHRKYVDMKNYYFKDKRILELDDDDFAVLAANYLILREGVILADQQGTKLHRRLQKEGVQVIEVDVSELKKGGGSIRCMTLPLWQG